MGMLVSVLVSLIVKGAISTLRELRHDHNKVRDSVEAIHLLLVGKFITKTDSDRAREILAQRMELAIAGIESRVRLLELRK